MATHLSPRKNRGGIVSSLLALERELEQIETGPVAVMDVHRRDVSDEQLRRFERYAAEMFAAFGMELDSAATRDTPRRFVRALLDATAGYEGDPKLLTAFDTECRGGPDCRLSQVIEGPIQFFYALCTVSPQVAGRDGDLARPGFVAGTSFAPEHPVWGALVGLKRGGDHLFLRYAFAADEDQVGHA
jgi:hypothetical protein